MILKESGRKKGKNLNKTLMKEIKKEKYSIEKLKLITFKNIVEGSRSINGVTWNKIKRLKGRNKNLLKNLFELIGVDKEEVLQLQFKISESENLDNFTKKDYELIYKLSGGDLLIPSTTRALVMLYSKEKIDA
jgi:hypothetical protein